MPKVTKIRKRFNEQELAKLEATFLTQLPTVAALLAEYADGPEAAAAEAIALVDALLDNLDGQEVEEDAE
jgi:hypothetical protein